MKLYEDKYPHNWFDDFPTEPIGRGNPYYQCVHCKLSVPQINYRLEGHDEWCKYRIDKTNILLSQVKTKR